MEKTYCVEWSTGRVSIVILPMEKYTILDYLDQMVRDKDKTHLAYYEVDIADLPDREFRNAWKNDDGKVGHNLNKARELQLDRIRESRVVKLAAQDYVINTLIDEEASDEDIKKARRRRIRLRRITEKLKNKALVDIEDVRTEFPEELK